MATDWIPVRLRRATGEALDRVARSMGIALEEAKISVDVSDRFGITVDTVVNYLVRHYQRHRERRQKSAKVRAARRQRDPVYEG